MDMTVKALKEHTEIVLRGRIDSADDATTKLQDELLKHSGRVIVNMKDVTYISSLGLLAFLKAHRKGLKITIQGANKDIRGNFSLSGMMSLFTFEDA